MKKNLTFRLDVTLIRKIRALAAEEGTSVSALLTSTLDRIIHERKNFNRAKKRALTRLRKGFDLQWSPPDSRSELHKRNT